MPSSPPPIKRLHAVYLTRGTQDPSPWCRVINHYLSHGSLKEALFVYTQNLPHRTQQSILHSILKACSCRLSLLGFCRSLHSECVKLGLIHDLMIGTTFVSVYSKCRQPINARKLFDEMPYRNVVAHNAMIKGYATSGDMGSALALFERLPDRSPVTWATMIEGFARRGDVAAARRFFDRITPETRTIVTWTVMVHAYTANGDMDDARELFDQMRVKNAFVWSSMIVGYFKKGDAREARAIFDRIPNRNLVNWNTLIAGYTQIGCCKEALEAFRLMREHGFEPDEFTAATVLSACAQLSSLEHGKEIHKMINRKRIKKNFFILNGLIDMYAKCGDLESSRAVFDGMSRRNISCWNTMIDGLASHGRCKEAVQLFARMEESGERPGSITFLVVLSACTHGGLVDKGMEIFAKMENYGLVAGVEHYGCLVDLLGRAGRLAEAYDVIEKMPMKPNEVVWGSLLGACSLHMDKCITERVMRQLGDLSSTARSTNDADYVVISNIYAASEKWEAREKVRSKMLEHGIHKTPGCSSVTVENLEDRFYSHNLLESRA